MMGWMSAIMRHMRANGLEPQVADSVPLRAAASMNMQSVLVVGGNGVSVSTRLSAHSSAGAAVATRDGGLP